METRGNFSWELVNNGYTSEVIFVVRVEIRFKV
jgi:hypothetical protein